MRVFDWGVSQVRRVYGVLKSTVRHSIAFFASRKPRFPLDPESQLHAIEIQHGGQVTLWYSSWCQAFLVFGYGALWIGFNGEVLPFLVGLIAGFALHCRVFMCLRRELRSEKPGADGGSLAWLFWLGFVWLVVIGFLLINLLSRISHHALTWLFLVPLMMYALLEGIKDQVAAESQDSDEALTSHLRRSKTWFFVWVTIVFSPLFSGWVVASLVTELQFDDSKTVRAWLDDHPHQWRPILRDRNKSQQDKWTVDGRPVRVALLLSGGGYRAAVTHAGVLAALEEQHVPIDIISSVSGGSIIGTSYVLGVPPREFKSRLQQQKPGLPQAVLNVANIFQNTTETYHEHVREMYFGNRTLKSLPKSPALLINVTNIYSKDPSQAREFIRQEWSDKSLDSMLLASAVTASGAYPGAFQPIEVNWQTRTRLGNRIGSHFLLDGGIVENLGTEGLREYLTALDWKNWYRKRPDLLIVSDASGYAGSGERLVINPAADEMLIRSNAILFDSLHRHIYQELTGEIDLPARISSRPAERQFYTIDYPRRFVPRFAPKVGSKETVLTQSGQREITVEQERLTTVVIPITLRATKFLLMDHSTETGPRGQSAVEVFERVNAFPTLKELDTDEVEDAFWLGHKLGALYGRAIECARRQLQGNDCVNHLTKK